MAIAQFACKPTIEELGQKHKWVSKKVLQCYYGCFDENDKNVHRIKENVDLKTWNPTFIVFGNDRNENYALLSELCTLLITLKE